uniref:Uncharacterized protein n=1 Tax=Wuchereria bancrofti TaxID=6293 RepID=A0A1I8EV18_WUCBA
MSAGSLSKVQPDLLLVDSSKQMSHLIPLDGTKSLNRSAAVYKKDLEAPKQLKTASQINRGPPGISHSSHLHWDLLLGKDETIEPCDYLNFDYTVKF